MSEPFRVFAIRVIGTVIYYDIEGNFSEDKTPRLFPTDPFRSGLFTKLAKSCYRNLEVVEFRMREYATRQKAAPTNPASVRDRIKANLLENGQKIQAIKFAKDLLGVGLKQAKYYVDTLIDELSPEEAEAYDKAANSHGGSFYL